MDFFASQDHARRNTKLLLVLFLAAITSLVILTNLLLLGLATFSDSAAVASGQFNYDWQTVAGVSVLVIVVIGLGSLYRIVSLASGGEAVAEMLDGKLLSDPGGDFKKRRLLNVVEEMAIAAGVPVPPVYVIADPAINAFAAGYASGDAVIGITQGAIDTLNRDQLQGVIAHEFSHILNGDMRLNIRLMGILYGILMLAVIGRLLLYSRHGASRRDSGGAIVAVGIGLFALGYIGRFFGNVIKAAVSRQREFLADASAVQFTRDPSGISGALKRIGGYTEGSVVDNANSEEVSHAFFCQGINVMFNSVMATHPPLPDRIRRLDPNWDGEFLAETVDPGPEADDRAPVSGFAAGAGMAASPEAVVEEVGNPVHNQLAQARNLISQIPEKLVLAVHEPYSARAVVYLVLLDADELVRARQVDHLASSADPNVYSRFQELLPQATAITPAIRLPLLEMAMPSLRQLTRDQYERFIENVDVLIRADQKIGLSEWALQKFVTKHLGEAFDKRRSHPRHSDLGKVAPHCARLLSMLAYCDSAAGLDPAATFEKGRALLELDITLMDKSDLRLSSLNESVDILADLRPLLKPRLLKACVATIAADGRIAPVEAELVRAIADSLDCPLPPMPDESVAQVTNAT